MFLYDFKNCNFGVDFVKKIAEQDYKDTRMKRMNAR